MRTLILAGGVSLALASPPPEIAEPLRVLRAVGPEGQGNAAASAAWKKLAAGNATTLLPLLAAMDGANDYALNWLRAAVEAVASRELAAGHPLPLLELKQFLRETEHNPRARRLAFELVARMDPATADQLLAGMLNDPSLELRRDAVQKLVDQADQALARTNPVVAGPLLQSALRSARDVPQIEGIAGKLQELGQPVDLQKHFGFLAAWKVIGPFDNTGNKGFETAFPPELKIDLAAEYDGKKGKVRWQDYVTRHKYGMVDMNQPCGKLKEVTAYATTDFFSDRARPVELRLGGKNSWCVWLNGKLLFAHDEYHTTAEIDQYVMPVQLQPGRNTILVKVLPERGGRSLDRGMGISTAGDRRPRNAHRLHESTPQRRRRKTGRQPRPEQLMNAFRNSVAASRQSAAFIDREHEVGGALPRRCYAREILREPLMNLTFPLLFLAASTTLSGADWRQFRGPHGNGATDEANIPTVLNVTNSIAWKSNLPGRGLSSPIIVGDRVFVTCSSGLNQQRLHVICFNAADGAKLWERQFWATGRTMCHEKTAVAAPTPASDGEHVVAIFSSNDIVCLDLDGNLIWFRGLGRDYPHASNSLGMTSSLLIAGGVVVAQVESQSEAFTAGLELATGVNRWKLSRARGPNWTSPVRLQTGGAELIALQSAKGIAAIEPATGKTVWNYTNNTSTKPSSTLSGNTLLVPSQGLTALEFGSGETTPKQLWRSGQLNPGTPSPTVLGGKVFTLNDGGVLTCGDAATGARLWQLRLKGPFSASPVGAGQFLYCVNEKGLAQVVDTTKPEGEIVSELDLGETVLSTPSIAHGAIYFRSDGRLWKIGKS